MTTEDDFRTALVATPEDWQTLLVFSDWLRDRDDPRADGYAALARLRKCPSGETIKRRAKAGWVGDWFVWAKAGDANRGREYAKPGDPDALPPDWYDAAKGLNQLPQWDPGAWSYFRSRPEALDAAAVGFAKLTAARRAELLAGAAEPPASGPKQPVRRPKRK